MLFNGLYVSSKMRVNITINFGHKWKKHRYVFAFWCCERNKSEIHLIVYPERVRSNLRNTSESSEQFSVRSVTRCISNILSSSCHFTRLIRFSARSSIAELRYSLFGKRLILPSRLSLHPLILRVKLLAVATKRRKGSHVVPSACFTFVHNNALFSLREMSSTVNR